MKRGEHYIVHGVAVMHSATEEGWREMDRDREGKSASTKFCAGLATHI